MRSDRQTRIRFTGPGRQRGVTLLIGLVILTILTLLTISSLRDMGVQTAMVRNNQLELLAFNTTLSDINAQIDKINVDNDESLLLEALNDPESEVELAADDFVEDQGGQFEMQGTVEHVSEKPLPGYSAGVYRGLIFEYDEQSSLPGTGTRSRQVQGIYYIAPE